MLLDLLVLLLLAGFTFFYYKIGFVKALLGLCSGILSLTISMLLMVPLTQWLMTTQFATNTCQTIEQNIRPLIEKNNPLSAENTMQNTDNLPPLESFLQTQITLAASSAAKNINETLSKMLTEALFKVIILVIVFVVLKIGFKICVMALDAVTRLPVLNAVNNAFGAILGFLTGLLIVYITFAVIGLVGLTRQPALAEQINSSVSSQLFYNNNFIVNSVLPTHN